MGNDGPDYWPSETVVCFSSFSAADLSFFLSPTGQAGLIQVETPMRGKSHPCRKNQAAMMPAKIKTSFIFHSPLSSIQVLINDVGNLLLRHQADDRVFNLTVFKNQKGGDAADTVLS